MDKLGITEIKEVMALGLAVGELIESLSDGVGISDIGSLIGVVRKAPSAIAALKSGMILPELKDLDEAEKAELKQFAKDNFDLKDDAIEEAVEKGISVAVDLSALLKMLK